MPDNVGYQAPDVVNQFNQGQRIGMESNAMQQNAEMNKQRMGLMSQEMKMRLDENTRKIGKENAMELINAQANVAMAAKMAEQEGRDPAAAYSAAYSSTVKKYPALANQMPKDFSPANVDASLALSTEAMDHVMKMNMDAAKMKQSKEEHNAMMQNYAENRAQNAEEFKGKREDRALDRDLMKLKIENEKANNASGLGSPELRAASSVYKAYATRFAKTGETVDDLTPDERGELDLARSVLKKNMGGSVAPASAAPVDGAPAASPPAASVPAGNRPPLEGLLKF